MHGDFVNAICYTAFCPVYAYLWYQEPCVEARNVNLSFVWTMIFSWISYCRNSVWTSALAITGMTVSIAFMNLYGWPHAGQVVVEPQFLWSLLIISGNGFVPYKPKIAFAIVALSGAAYVAHESPLVEFTFVLPTLLGAFVIFCAFHHLTSKESKKLVSAYGASILLAGSFSFHVTSEMIKIVTHEGYGKSGGYSILVAGFFAIVGFFSSKAFQQEINLNDQLEAAVKERTREVEQQAKRLVVVEHALQASDTGIAVLDSDYSILWSNGSFKSMLRLEKDLGSGRMFDTFKLLKSNNDSRVRVDGGEANRTSEVKLGNRSFSLELSEFPGVVSNGGNKRKGLSPPPVKTKRYLLVMKDITAIRAREAAEKAAEQEAAQAKAMEEAMQNLSHELRTPLQGIMGMTSLMLSNEAINSEVAESMTMVMTSSRLLLTLINNMLDVQKLNANMLGEFAMSSCSLPQILKGAVDFCLPLATVHDLAVKIEDSGEDDSNMIVRTNSLRLQQVVINLLSNAIKYSPVKGSILISARRKSMPEVQKLMARALASSEEPPTWHSTPTQENIQGAANEQPAKSSSSRHFAVVSVSDQGNGIPKEKAGELFRRFASNWSTCPRVSDDNTKEEPFGTGLGLNLCKRFVERMNGVIWVENHSGGATFSFALEVDDSVHPPPANGTERTRYLSRQKSSNRRLLDTPIESSTMGKSNTWTSQRILVVDDVRMNLKVAQRMLASIGIKNVDTALSGKEALDLICQAHSANKTVGDVQPYSVVISDLQMPFMSGLELSRAVRSLNLADLPVVVGFTADTSPDVVESCLSSGMCEVLHKPTTKEELQCLVYRLCSGEESKECT